MGNQNGKDIYGKKNRNEGMVEREVRRKESRDGWR